MTEYPVTKRPQRPPTHPGVLLRDDVLPALKISVSEAARQLQTTRATLHAIMAGTRAVSPDMAVKLGKFCGTGPELWLNMQQRHDLWHAERKLEPVLKDIPTHAAMATG